MFAYCPNAITPPTKEYASNKLSYVKATTSESAEIYCVCVNVVAVYVVAFLNHFVCSQKEACKLKPYCVEAILSVN